LIIGTAGHIDHGKTALVRALTGVDTDRLPEEKRRGITIDLGFAPLSLDDVGIVGIVDVPGHEDFVRSMLVGATGIDLGLLVIAADEGVMPQTREHLLILRLLDIPKIVVALTKSDLVDDEWRSLVRADVEALFIGERVAIPPIVSCSSRTGKGVGELRQVLAANLAGAPSRPVNDLFRLPVDRAFSVRGTGTVVTGTVWSGELATDATVRILPTAKSARARRIEAHGTPMATARAGARAAIALAGLDVDDVPRGSVLVTDPAWRPTSMFEAAVVVTSDIIDSISTRTQLRLHAGASEVGARVVFASGPDTGSSRLARITTSSPITLRGADRFVLRLPAPVRTVGGGTVIDPYARRRPLPELSATDLVALASRADARLRFILDAEGSVGLAAADLPVRLGCDPRTLAQLEHSETVVFGERNVFGLEVVQELMAKVRRIVAEYEISSPLSAGMPARTLRENLRVKNDLSDIAIRKLERAGEIEISGPLIKRKGWKPSPTAKDLDVSVRLAHEICAAGREPPGVGELVARYGSSVPAVLHFLERQGRLVQVETDRYYDRSTVDVLIAKLKAELVPERVYAPAELREMLGVSRKYLIPFLEFCDRQGLTERRGEGRVVRQTSDILLDTLGGHS
jgi:selenocysteine-specific elongation factor